MEYEEIHYAMSQWFMAECHKAGAILSLTRISDSLSRFTVCKAKMAPSNFIRNRNKISSSERPLNHFVITEYVLISLKRSLLEDVSE